MVGFPVGGTLVEGLADDSEGVGTIGVEKLAVWCDVAVWRDVAVWYDVAVWLGAGAREIVEDTKIKVAIILNILVALVGSSDLHEGYGSGQVRGRGQLENLL